MWISLKLPRDEIKMRLKCEVQVSNRQLPSLNLRKPSRPSYMQVSVGRKPGDRSKDGKVFLMLCSAQNKNGTKYLLHLNVEQIFSRFVKEGKATLRLSNPADDIAFSKADPNQLHIFLKLVKLASEGKEFPERALSTLVPASTKQIEKPVTSLDISRPSEYPMTFPKSLQRLMINGCNLRRISPQIMTLTELRSLDMSRNSMTTVPESFGQLSNLHTLNLSDNKLVQFPMVLCKSGIKDSLASLDLRNNELLWLPTDIVKLKSLHTLNLSHNKIKHIPESLALMRRLQNIFMSDNRLEILPGSLLARMFETVDFSNNPFSDWSSINIQQINQFSVPTLAEAAARVIVTYSIPYTSEDLDINSIDYLSKVHYCLCGKACFEASVSRLRKTRVRSNLSYSQGDLPFLVHYCSMTCLARFH